MTHDHAMNHESVFESKDTYEYVKCVVAVGLVLIRPNRGAEKWNPLLGLLGHTTHTLIVV